MDGGGGGRREVVAGELERLRAERQELDIRIRLLESELEAGSAAPASPAGEDAAAGVEDGLCGGGSGGACQTRREFVESGALPADMIYRYSRHLLLPDFGVEGQRKLSRSSVLVVGAGGLGSPVALYLAACGVGVLGIVDGDDVELNNLHRQIIHKEAYVGRSKVKSAADACRAINSSIKLVEHHHTLKPSNALEIVRKYDIVVDATDNLPTRYMISDCCVLLNKPLISGAALGLEGQVKIRGSSPVCTICGEKSVFTQEEFQKFDYEKFTESPMSDKSTPSLSLLPDSARVTCTEYKRMIDKGEPHLLLDVRPAHHFQITSLPQSLNIPLSVLEEKLPLLEISLKETMDTSAASDEQPSLYVVCRRGNDSQSAVQLLREKGFPSAKDIVGGLQSWAQDVDPDFPAY
ncbi:hypothetical protein BRADI_1g48130v3 [Brachypodium distachyon]|uniref:Rhodanese domain-containing protein n=1 Tax=Brachypodium distachyon TaxID=15368 RepID=A0A2K2DQ78_BRADI|nr:hypothetical protein BRADI_1g48130v3 [Brachypodium distachyon]